MSKEPLISIITVTYNVEKTIRQTLDSVLTQSFTDFEYIVIDGKSTDKTVEIVNEFRPQLAHFVSELDKSLYDAINKGIAQAKGKWIYCIQGDDVFVSKDSLAEVAKYLITTDADVVYGDANMTLDYGVKSSRNGQPMDTLWKSMPFSHQAMFVCANIAKKYPYDTQYRLAADYDLVYKLYKNGCKFEYVPVTVAVFSGGGRSDKQRMRGLKEVLKIKQNYDKNVWHIVLHRGHMLKSAVRLAIRQSLPASLVAGYFRNREKNREKMQIVLLGPGEIGGIGQYIRDVAANFQTPNITIVYTHNKKQSHLINVFVFLGALLKLKLLIFRALLSRHQIILHVNMAVTGSFLRKMTIVLVFATFVKGTVLHLHGAETALFFTRLARSSFGRKALKLCVNRPSKLLLVSNSSKTEVLEVLDHANIAYDASKIEVLPNAVRLPTVLSQPNKYSLGDVLNIASISRFEPQKNVFALLQIAQLLEESEIKFHFHVIGGGTQFKEFQREMEKLNVSDKFTLYGQVSNKEVDKILAQCSLFVLASKSESFGIVVLEAYRSGLAVVTSNVGGLNDIVINGVTGYTCSPLRPEEFAEKIKYFAVHLVELERFQRNAQKEVLKYGVTEHVHRLHEVYAGLV